MNTKIKNYVDVLFKDVPNTKKAKELKEEILSNLNDHFESHIAEGKSENQAYTDSLADLGDIDELLKDLEPEMDLKNKIDDFRKKRARNTAIAVMFYIFGVVMLIGFGAFGSFFEEAREEVMGVIGLILMFVFAAIGTGLLIYTNMSAPQDVKDYLTKNGEIPKAEPEKNTRLGSFMHLFWLIVLVVYLLVSFKTGAWYITWIIWIIGSAIKQAIYCFLNVDEKKSDCN